MSVTSRRPVLKCGTPMLRQVPIFFHCTFITQYVLQGHPKAKPYRTKAFPLYDDIAELVCGAHATGEQCYREGASQEDAHTRTATQTGTPHSVIDPALLPDLSDSDDGLVDSLV